MNSSTENAIKEDFFNLAEEIAKKFNIPKVEALTVAASFKRNIIEEERNSILENAFAVSGASPSALEAIAMQLGYSKQATSTIIDAIYSLNK